MAAKATKAPGKATLIVSVASLTLLAAIGGALVGKTIAAKLRALPPLHADTGDTPAGKSSAAGAAYSESTELRELAPIVTNLAEPAETRVRLQVAIVYPKKGVEAPNILAARITDDIVAFMKTLSVAQRQGASGLQALREDLNDRAFTRSDGKVKEVMIENLVVQ